LCVRVSTGKNGFTKKGAYEKMARIADKHGLTNKYRPPGFKRMVKRGRPRTYFLGSSKSRRRSTQTVSRATVAQNQVLTEKDLKRGRFATIVLVFIVIVLIVCASFSSNRNKKYVDYNFLVQPDHPMLYDEYDAVKDFYVGYENVSVGSYQVHEKVENPVITALSFLDYDRIYVLTLNLNNLGRKITMEEAIDIALDYVPVDMILEGFEFEKAIYKTKEDGKKQYECYYTQRKDGVEKPGYYYDGTTWIKLRNGFSLVIEETIDASYIIKMDTSWYDYVYNPITGRTQRMEEEIAAHQDWDFSIEEYLAGRIPTN
jgi:hypothetical protein